MKMLNDIRSAGAWFIGSFAEETFNKIEQLQNDKAYKGAYINKLYHETGRDSDLSGTRTRVNALIRIIKRNELVDALRYVIDSDRVKDNDYKAYNVAKKALENLSK